MKKFANKTAYATGGAAGIGKVVSLGLAKEGMDVAIVDVDLGGARKVSKEIEEMGRRSLAIQCDVTSEEGVQKMVDTIGVNPGNETIKLGTVLMGGTGSYERTTGIEPGVQACGVVTDGERRERRGAFARAESSP